MTRLFALVVAAAAIVPTAVLGGGGGFRYGPFPGFDYTVRQVQRAFATEGIRLTVSRDSQAPTVDLVGRLAPRAKLSVSVFDLQATTSRHSVQFILATPANGFPREWGWASNGNVVADWWSNGSCHEQAAWVASALRRLGTGSNGMPPRVRCQPLTYP